MPLSPSLLVLQDAAILQLYSTQCWPQLTLLGNLPVSAWATILGECAAPEVVCQDPMHRAVGAASVLAAQTRHQSPCPLGSQSTPAQQSRRSKLPRMLSASR